MSKFKAQHGPAAINFFVIAMITGAFAFMNRGDWVLLVLLGAVVLISVSASIANLFVLIRLRQQSN